MPTYIKELNDARNHLSNAFARAKIAAYEEKFDASLEHLEECVVLARYLKAAKDRGDLDYNPEYHHATSS